ncbi:hypothetical protein ACS0TY_015311 [Phlomoides rotata]
MEAARVLMSVPFLNETSMVIPVSINGRIFKIKVFEEYPMYSETEAWEVSDSDTSSLFSSSSESRGSDTARATVHNPNDDSEDSGVEWASEIKRGNPLTWSEKPGNSILNLTKP